MKDTHNQKGAGRGFHKSQDPTGEKHAQAGQKGGKETARTHGPEFYSEIGREGGKNSPTKFKKNDERTRELAREGGQARAESRQDDDQ